MNIKPIIVDPYGAVGSDERHEVIGACSHEQIKVFVCIFHVYFNYKTVRKQKKLLMSMPSNRKQADYGKTFWIHVGI